LNDDKEMEMIGMRGAVFVVAVAGLCAVPAGAAAQQQQQPMGFFITSVGPEDGGNLSGLTGADAHCQALAQAVGAGGRTWRAYLSQNAGGQLPQVHARDRIGNGPWYNANGQRIAWDLADLHGDHQRDSNNIRKPTALNERGEEVNGAGDQPNQHDILTGSDSHGRALPGSAQVNTCNNWTSNDTAHRAVVGHHDRLGGANASWNAVHHSGGCSQENLVATGGAGLFYCFAES
jgi:hypothetical protein